MYVQRFSIYCSSVTLRKTKTGPVMTKTTMFVQTHIILIDHPPCRTLGALITKLVRIVRLMNINGHNHAKLAATRFFFFWVLFRSNVALILQHIC